MSQLVSRKARTQPKRRAKQLSTVAILLLYRLVDVSKRFSRSISLAVYRLSVYIFWLIRSLVDPTLAAFIVCGPLQFLVSH